MHIASAHFPCNLLLFFFFYPTHDTSTSSLLHFLHSHTAQSPPPPPLLPLHLLPLHLLPFSLSTSSLPSSPPPPLFPLHLLHSLLYFGPSAATTSLLQGRPPSLQYDLSTCNICNRSTPRTAVPAAAPPARDGPLPSLAPPFASAVKPANKSQNLHYAADFL